MTGPDDREQVAAARAEVHRVLGSALAEKATDAFCLLHQRRMAGAGLDELASATKDARKKAGKKAAKQRKELEKKAAKTATKVKRKVGFTTVK